MKRFVVFLLVLVLSSFVMAASSETSANFNIVDGDSGKSYVSPTSFWDVYGGYIVGAVIVLIIIIVFSKGTSRVSRGKVKRRRVRRR
jgi:hypothetical protein